MSTTMSISIPNPIFESAERLSRKLGLSRNELYSKALTTYLNAHQDNEITAALNDVYATETSTISPALIEMQVVTVEESW